MQSSTPRPDRLEPFARVLIESSRDWIAAKRQAMVPPSAPVPLGFECHLHDETGERTATITVPPGPLLAVARFVESLAACTDAPLLAVCSEGLIFDPPDSDVIARFEAGDPSVESALVVVVGERSSRRISSVQFPFVDQGDRIEILSLRSGDRAIDVRDLTQRAALDPLAGPIASALALGFATDSADEIAARVPVVGDTIRRLEAEAGLAGPIVVRRPRRASRSAVDGELLDAVFPIPAD